MFEDFDLDLGDLGGPLPEPPVFGPGQNMGWGVCAGGLSLGGRLQLL